MLLMMLLHVGSTLADPVAEIPCGLHFRQPPESPCTPRGKGNPFRALEFNEKTEAELTFRRAGELRN